MVERLKEVMEENGPENQCGFRPERGTIDGTFNLLMALRKRQEHNLETYVSFVDLVKAFDSVPRAALFKSLWFARPLHQSGDTLARRRSGQLQAWQGRGGGEE